MPTKLVMCKKYFMSKIFDTFLELYFVGLPYPAGDVYASSIYPIAPKHRGNIEFSISLTTIMASKYLVTLKYI